MPLSRKPRKPRKRVKRRKRMTYARAVQILKKHGLFHEKTVNQQSGSFLLGAL